MGSVTSKQNAADSSIDVSRFNTLFEDSPTPCQILAREGTTVLVNKAWMNLWGFTEDFVQNEFLNKYNLLEDAYLESTGVTSYLRRAFSGEQVDIPASYYDPTVNHLPGSARWIKTYLLPIKNGSQLVEELIMIQQDITEQKKAEEDLRTAANRHRTLTQTAPVGIFEATPDGNVTFINERWSMISGQSMEQALADGWKAAVHPEDAEWIGDLWDGTVRRGGTFKGEYRFMRVDGSVTWVHGQGTPIRNDNGDITGYVGTITDITDQKNYEEALRHQATHIQRMVDERTIELQERTAELQESNKKLSDDIAARMKVEKALRHSQSILTAAQKIAHLASWEYDIKTGQLRCSDEWFRIYGLEPQSMQPTIEHAHSITHPDDLERAKRTMADAGVDDANYQLEKRIVRPDGSIRHLITKGEKIYNDQSELIAIVGAVLDITPHKEAEIALRQLAARQESVREDERKRIARELHDELGSLLSSIKTYLSVSMERSQAAGTTPDPLMADAVDLADSAIDSMRRIITDLRPSVLDLLGIWAALEWQLEQIQKQTNLVCEYSMHPDAALIEPDAERSVALFRITQEALTNIVRHADASRIAIHVACSDNIVVVKIQDDGKGFHVDGHYDQHTSWGILGMHERARHFGGEVDIVSNALQGTTVTLRMPLSKPGVE